jgi:soluble epoxide hydrolase / lipid-phosphate phosphatase
MPDFAPPITKKTLTVPRGFNYTYYTSPPSLGKPTILLCHGWPDEAKLWAPVVNDHLLPSGYGIIVPDLLGYSGTSKPRHHSAYAMDLMASDLTALLDAESISQVVVLGHDWGSALAQRFYLFHPDRVAGLVTVNVAYISPLETPFDIAAGCDATQKAFGYGAFWYWELFGADDGPQVLGEHPETIYGVCHEDPKHWFETFCRKGGMRAAVTGSGRREVLPYAAGQPEEEFVQRMRRDGFEGPQNWYRAWLDPEVGFAAEKKIKEENRVVKVPYLHWGGRQDWVCRPEAIEDPKGKGLVPKLTEVVREGGHWAFLALPDVFGNDLVKWLDETFKREA